MDDRAARQFRQTRERLDTGPLCSLRSHSRCSNSALQIGDKLHPHKQRFPNTPDAFMDQ